MPIASLFVPSSESMNSTTYAALATAESVTFDMPFDGDVIIDYVAEARFPSGTSPQYAYSRLSIDGVAASASEERMGGVAIQPVSGENGTRSVQFLTAGPHTVAVEHKVDTDVAVVSWKNRLLTITLKP